MRKFNGAEANNPTFFPSEETFTKWQENEKSDVIRKLFQPH